MINGLQLYGTARRFYFRWYGLTLTMFTWNEACLIMQQNNQRVITDFESLKDFEYSEEECRE